MTENAKDENAHHESVRKAVLGAALPHVSFDGWSKACLLAAIKDAGVDRDLAHLVFPRGALDLAIAYHRDVDESFLAAFEARDFEGLRISERVSEAIWIRLELSQKEAVRAGMVRFSQPKYADEGAALLWETSDKIWRALSDRSDDINYYTKRMSLSAVYLASVLYWLGDTSFEDRETRSFIARRIADVMRIERLKSKLKKTPFGKLAEALTSNIKAPSRHFKQEFPGYPSRD